MQDLKWCMGQAKGIRLISPNKLLSEEYLRRAKSDYENIKNQNQDWKLIVSYYASYNAFYSVLMIYGIKSEIHDCTIKLLKLFFRLEKYVSFILDLKENRINTQYYLKKPKMINVLLVKDFIDMCELELIEVNQKKIENVRKKLSIQ